MQLILSRNNSLRDWRIRIFNNKNIYFSIRVPRNSNLQTSTAVQPVCFNGPANGNWWQFANLLQFFQAAKIHKVDNRYGWANQQCSFGHSFCAIGVSNIVSMTFSIRAKQFTACVFLRHIKMWFESIESASTTRQIFSCHTD